MAEKGSDTHPVGHWMYTVMRLHAKRKGSATHMLLVMEQDAIRLPADKG